MNSSEWCTARARDDAAARDERRDAPRRAGRSRRARTSPAARSRRRSRSASRGRRGRARARSRSGRYWRPSRRRRCRRRASTLRPRRSSARTSARTVRERALPCSRGRDDVLAEVVARMRVGGVAPSCSNRKLGAEDVDAHAGERHVRACPGMAGGSAGFSRNDDDAVLLRRRA